MMIDSISDIKNNNTLYDFSILFISIIGFIVAIMLGTNGAPFIVVLSIPLGLLISIFFKKRSQLIAEILDKDFIYLSPLILFIILPILVIIFFVLIITNINYGQYRLILLFIYSFIIAISFLSFSRYTINQNIPSNKRSLYTEILWFESFIIILLWYLANVSIYYDLWGNDHLFHQSIARGYSKFDFTFLSYSGIYRFFPLFHIAIAIIYCIEPMLITFSAINLTYGQFLWLCFIPILLSIIVWFCKGIENKYNTRIALSCFWLISLNPMLGYWIELVLPFSFVIVFWLICLRIFLFDENLTLKRMLIIVIISFIHPFMIVFSSICTLLFLFKLILTKWVDNRNKMKNTSSLLENINTKSRVNLQFSLIAILLVSLIVVLTISPLKEFISLLINDLSLNFSQVVIPSSSKTRILFEFDNIFNGIILFFISVYIYYLIKSIIVTNDYLQISKYKLIDLLAILTFIFYSLGYFAQGFGIQLLQGHRWLAIGTVTGILPILRILSNRRELAILVVSILLVTSSLNSDVATNNPWHNKGEFLTFNEYKILTFVYSDTDLVDLVIIADSLGGIAFPTSSTSSLLTPIRTLFVQPNSFNRYINVISNKTMIITRFRFLHLILIEFNVIYRSGDLIVLRICDDIR